MQRPRVGVEIGDARVHLQCVAQEGREVVEPGPLGRPVRGVEQRRAARGQVLAGRVVSQVGGEVGVHAGRGAPRRGTRRRSRRRPRRVATSRSGSPAARTPHAVGGSDARRRAAVELGQASSGRAAGRPGRCPGPRRAAGAGAAGSQRAQVDQAEPGGERVGDARVGDVGVGVRDVQRDVGAGSAGGRSGPCTWSGATDDTPRSSSGWCATIRSAPASERLGDGLRDAVDDAEHPAYGLLRLAQHQADPVPLLGPRRRVSLVQQRRPRPRPWLDRHGRSSLPRADGVSRAAAGAPVGGSRLLERVQRQRATGTACDQVARRARADAAAARRRRRARATPQSRSRVDGSPGTPGAAAMAALVNGTATIGRPLPCPSTSRPRASVSVMPAAHLLIVLTVAGRDDDRVRRRQHVGVAGVLVVACAPGGRSAPASAATSTNLRPSGRGRPRRRPSRRRWARSTRTPTSRATGEPHTMT